MVAAFLIGLLLGSFANVCIVRIPLGESVIIPRSHCRRCGLILKWWENIPLFSFVMLRGRCRRCRQPISWAYPLVELAAGFLVMAVYWNDPRWGPALFAAVFFFLPLLVAAVIDWHHLILPDSVTLPGTVAGLAYHLFFPVLLPAGARLPYFLDGLIGAALGLGLTWSVSALYRYVRRREGLGGGDVKLAMMLGAWLGWEGVLGSLFLASFIGTIAGGGWLLLKRQPRSTPIPFGPFFIGAAWLYFFRGEVWIDWYLRWTSSLL